MTDDSSNTNSDEYSGGGTINAPDAHTVPMEEESTSRTDTLTPHKVDKASFSGVQLGDYRLGAILGQGGFGAVYKAKDVKLDRDIAIKFLKSSKDPHHKMLFEREAKAIAALGKHPNIVQIYAWGEHNEYSYFALEYVQSSVLDMMEEHAEGLPVHDALRIIAQCAEGLSYAHKKGILHRDVKPANILIEEEDGSAKIADFGLARLSESSQNKLTIEGAVSGSPPYMSPEQAKGIRLDERSDIFSLGVTLYQLLCGQRPFDGATFSEVMDRIINDNPTPLKDRKSLSPGILAIVDKSMAHKPEDRFQTAGEFAKCLRRALRELEHSGSVSSADIVKRPIAPRIFKYGSIAAAILIAIAIVISFGLLKDGGDNNVLASAIEKIESGNASAAEALYRKCLENDAQNDEVHYGLGYALLQQGKHDEALAAFQMIQKPDQKSEGEIAVAVENHDKSVKSKAEAAKGTSAYIDALLARLDNLEGKYDAAAQRLGRLEIRQFPFKWQYYEALETLSKAHYHLGKFTEAKSSLDKLGTSPVAGYADMANDYKALMKRRDDRSDLREQMDALLKAKEERGLPEPTEDDKWTSRPLRFIARPTEKKGGAIAWESGLADLLPLWLERSLSQKTSLKAVNRSDIDEILGEQTISAYLASGEDAIQLQQMMSGRIALSCEFMAFGDEELLTIKMVDNETSQSYWSEEITIAKPLNRNELISKVTDIITNLVEKNYPLRGKLTSGENGPEINLGASVGINEGKKFVVAALPSTKAVIPDRTVIVDSQIGPSNAIVTLEGFVSEKMDNDLYVIDAEWHEKYAMK